MFKTMMRTMKRDEFEYYRDLVIGMVQTELKARHYQKLLGPIWWLLEPTFYAFIYFFLTTIMFRFSGGVDHLVYLFTMVVFWRWFSRTFENSPYLVISYQSLFKQTNFNTPIIILVHLLVETSFFIFGFIVLFIIYFLYGIEFSHTIIYLPLILLTQFMLGCAFTVIFATIGVFVRDIGHFISLFVGLWFYVSPGIYPIEMVPQNLVKLYNINPFATIFPALQDVLLLGKTPNVFMLNLWLLISTVASALGLWLFFKTKRKFYKYL